MRNGIYSKFKLPLTYNSWSWDYLQGLIEIPLIVVKLRIIYTVTA